MPGSRQSSDLAGDGRQDQSREPGSQWYRPEPFEMLLALALILAGIEAALHARGRIP
jgi:hypothetical protein